MMRLCLIGNSHLACLKLWWGAIQQNYANVETTWFGAPGKWDLLDEGGRLLPPNDSVRNGFALTSGGKTEIDPNLYDAFLLCGLDVNVRRAFHLALTFKPYSIRSLETEHIVSDELFTAAVIAGIKQAPGMLIARALRTLSTSRVILFPVPMPSEGIVRVRKKYASFYQDGAGDKLAQLFRDAVTNVASAAAAEIVWQPEWTIAKGMFSSEAFSVGSRRIFNDKLHPESDHWHMNQKFGEIVMEHILGSLGERVTTRQMLA